MGLIETGGWVVAAISGVTLVARELIRRSKHARNNAAQIAVSEHEHDAAVAPLLADRVKSVEAALAAKDAKIDELREAMGVAREKDRAECERMRREDKVECEKYTESRVAPLESMISTLAGIQRRSMGPDDTGVHEVERIARRTPTPTSTPALRTPELAKTSSREDMRLETMLPPKRGEE